jgi:hypothetical protein
MSASISEVSATALSSRAASALASADAGSMTPVTPVTWGVETDPTAATLGGGIASCNSLHVAITSSSASGTSADIAAAFAVVSADVAGAAAAASLGFSAGSGGAVRTRLAEAEWFSSAAGAGEGGANGRPVRACFLRHSKCCPVALHFCRGAPCEVGLCLDGDLHFASVGTIERERLGCIAAEVALVQELLIVLRELHRHALFFEVGAGGDHGRRAGDGDFEVGHSLGGSRVEIYIRLVPVVLLGVGRPGRFAAGLLPCGLARRDSWIRTSLPLHSQVPSHVCQFHNEQNKADKIQRALRSAVRMAL